MASNSTASPPTTTDYATAYNGYHLHEIAITFTVLEVVTVCLRFVSKKVGGLQYHLDDWLMIPTVLLCVGINAACLVAMADGAAGHHWLTVLQDHPEKIAPWIKVVVSMPLMLAPAISLCKIAILLFYLRIFTDRTSRIVAYVLITSATVNIVLGEFLAGFLCHPLSNMWDHGLAGSCPQLWRYYRWAPLPYVFTSSIMVVLPLPTIWSVRTSRKNRVLLTVNFMTTAIALVGSIWRMIEFFMHDPLNDATWVSPIFMTGSVVEVGEYLMAANLIHFRPLILYIRRSLLDLLESWRPIVEREELHHLGEIEKQVDVTVVRSVMTRLGEEGLWVPLSQI